MRLLTKTTLYFLVAMIPLLAAAGFYLYNQFSRELNRRMDEELVTEEIQWIRYLQRQADNGTTFSIRTPELLIYPVNAPVSTYPKIEDRSNSETGSKFPFRELSHIVPINGIPYLITIRRSQEQKAALEFNVTRIMLLVFAGLFIATLLFNWFISRNLWRPFRKSLEKIRGAKLQEMEAIHFEETNIKEFNELNSSLNIMADKIHRDYENMKEFTENAAHEMQTPLAVVQSKMELLLQDTNLNEGQIQSVAQASEAINRLSKLNRSLLLIAKIGNNQYESKEEISLIKVTRKYRQLFDELIKDKGIVLETDFNEDFVVMLHPFLGDTLISNLLGNAVKYNYQNGKITISINQNNFTITNTSNLLPIESSKVFKRFSKSSNSEETSNGLGLAIVKQIADTHNLLVNYNARNGIHEFTIQKS